MDKTVGYLLCCQSPMLFFIGAVLLLCYFDRRKRHHIRAVIDGLMAALCGLAGIALYFVGMSRNHFTIRDFYRIRGVGWFGLLLAVAATVFFGIRNFLRYGRRKRKEREANRAENQRLNREKKGKELSAPTAPVPAETAESTAEAAQTQEDAPDNKK